MRFLVLLLLVGGCVHASSTRGLQNATSSVTMCASHEIEILGDIDRGSTRLWDARCRGRYYDCKASIGAVALDNIECRDVTNQ